MSKADTELRSPVTYRDLHRILVRDWAGYLNVSQMACINFIFDRTIGWGKETERITNEQFVNGVQSADGKNRYSAGCGLSLSGAKKCVRELRKIGAITVTDGWYRINFELHYDMLKRSKKAKAGEKAGHHVTESGHPVTQSRSPRDHKEKKRREGKIREDKIGSGQAATDDTSPLEDIIEKAKSRSAAARQRKIEKAKLKPVGTQAELRALWESKLKRFELEAETTKMLDWKILQNYLQKYTTAVRGRMSTPYLEWVLDHWAWLVTDMFGWMDNPPAPRTPRVRFLVGFASYFESAYANQKQMVREMKMTGRERMIERLQAKGYDFDTAEREADEMLGLKKQKEELEKATHAAKQQDWKRKTEKIAEERRSQREKHAASMRKKLEKYKDKAGNELPFGEWEG